MVRVFRGKLPGERAEGYHQYRSHFGTIASYDVRRTTVVDKRMAPGTSREQQSVRERFRLMNIIYNNLPYEQRRFYRNNRKIDIRIDEQGKTYKRLLRGRSLGMHEIATALKYI